MASRNSSVWQALLPAIAVLGLATVWSGYWYWLFTEAQHLYQQEARRLSADGLALDCASQDWGGYPFRLEMNCARPNFSDTGPALIDRAEAGNLLLVMQAYDYRRVAALLDGPTVIALRGNAAPLTLTHQRALGAFHRLSDADMRLSLEIPAPHIDDVASAVTASLHFRARDHSILDIAASADGLALNIDEAKPLAIDKLAFEATLPLALLSAADPLRAAAETGAKLTVTRASLAEGELTISGEGSFTVTAQGHLDGRLKTVVNDLDFLLKALQDTLPLGQKDITELRTIGGALTGVSGAKSVAVDLVAKDGAIYWGFFKLGEVAPLF